MRPYAALSRVYDEWMAHLDYDRWADYLWSLLSARGIGNGSRIVDLACGTGLISARLARRGCRVTAIDSSPEMLAQARAREPAGADVEWLLMDMRGFRVHGTADAAVCACDGVNYLTSIADVDRCFARVSAALRDGGWFLFDVSSRDKLLSMDGQFYGQETDSAACLWRNRLDAAREVLTMDMTFFIDDGSGRYERTREVHRQRAHGAGELSDALVRAGFDPPDAYGAFTLRPPAAGDRRIQFAARKSRNI